MIFDVKKRSAVTINFFIKTKIFYRKKFVLLKQFGKFSNNEFEN